MRTKKSDFLVAAQTRSVSKSMHLTTPGGPQFSQGLR